MHVPKRMFLAAALVLVGGWASARDVPIRQSCHYAEPADLLEAVAYSFLQQGTAYREAARSREAAGDAVEAGRLFGLADRFYRAAIHYGVSKEPLEIEAVMLPSGRQAAAELGRLLIRRAQDPSQRGEGAFWLALSQNGEIDDPDRLVETLVRDHELRDADPRVIAGARQAVTTWLRAPWWIAAPDTHDGGHAAGGGGAAD